jgi:hypothetical protein
MGGRRLWLWGDALMKVVGIHGIRNSVEAKAIVREWLPNLQIGLENAGFPEISADDFTIVSYADIFKTAPGKGSGLDTSFLDEGDEGEWEAEFLLEIWKAVASQDSRVQGPKLEGQGPKTKGPKADFIQTAIKRILKAQPFYGYGEAFVMRLLTQVGPYLKDEKIKQKIQARVLEKVTAETQVIIGHSLGSVVAYECLCQSHPDWNVKTLVTLGSPLGIHPSVFDRLQPNPQDGKGVYPAVKRWINVADERDVVALEKNLSKYFGEVEDYLVAHSSEDLMKFHDVKYYLRAEETGRAIGQGLS